ncbi:hypothetical protein D9758_002128 [Tetrapyrgos nigripes]|uniref:Uncharacterized protein n=1 Tax=Tetrapyrgos nigripes TaxID=182062 RepID=A0A8H5GTG9_9AGAR|nr:hypothetical protein D9758_002128 [Tetrapyrgos nigripes]
MTLVSVRRAPFPWETSSFASSMPPKGYRSTTSQLRPASRNSSSSKLQLTTQKDAHVPYNTTKKNPQTRVQRTTSSQRLVQPPPNKQPPKLKDKRKGFTLSQDSDGEDDDDDEWVSSESGAATPNHNDNLSHSESDSEEGDARTTNARSVTPPASSTPLQKPVQLPLKQQLPHVGIARVDTIRQDDFHPIPQIQTQTQPPAHQQPPPKQRKSTRPTSMQLPHQPNPNPTIPHPPHQPLRPHPLIRGNSLGFGGALKPFKALTPLTTTTSPTTPNTSATPTIAMTTPNLPPAELSASPPVYASRDERADSPATISVSPPSPDPRSHRRTSISSARSVATLPVLPSASGGNDFRDYRQSLSLYSQNQNSSSQSQGSGNGRRHRTLSSLSGSTPLSSSVSSSSAAISSLVNASGYSHGHGRDGTTTFGGRPSSPGEGASGNGTGSIRTGSGKSPAINTDLVCFFPRPQSLSHQRDPQPQPHPLLPPPYLSTHLTVLSHRTPIREAYDRVLRAKMGVGYGYGHASGYSSQYSSLGGVGHEIGEHGHGGGGVPGMGQGVASVGAR